MGKVGAAVAKVVKHRRSVARRSPDGIMLEITQRSDWFPVNCKCHVGAALPSRYAGGAEAICQGRNRFQDAKSTRSFVMFICSVALTHVAVAMNICVSCSAHIWFAGFATHRSTGILNGRAGREALRGLSTGKRCAALAQFQQNLVSKIFYYSRLKFSGTTASTSNLHGKVWRPSSHAQLCIAL